MLKVTRDRQEKKNWIESRMRRLNIIEIDKERNIDRIGKIKSVERKR